MDIWQQGLAEPLIQFIKNPSDTNISQKMYQIFANNKSFQEGAAKKLLKNEAFKELFETWYLPGHIDIEELLSLPKETFGHVYAQFMRTNQITPNFISEFKGKDILSYLWARARHVHDISHIMIDADTTLMGEIRVKGFELAQYSSPSTAATTSAGLCSLVCLMPDKVNEIFSAFLDGYRCGERFPLLMAIKWDTEWQTPMSELKTKYGIPNDLLTQL